jgi:hypothetical protein
MRPVLEHRLVDALSLAQMVALVPRNARVKNVVMTTFDHVDRVDLHVAEMLDRCARGRGSIAERRVFVEPLGAEP